MVNFSLVCCKTASFGSSLVVCEYLGTVEPLKLFIRRVRLELDAYCLDLIEVGHTKQDTQQKSTYTTSKLSFDPIKCQEARSKFNVFRFKRLNSILVCSTGFSYFLFKSMETHNYSIPLMGVCILFMIQI